MTMNLMYLETTVVLILSSHSSESSSEEESYSIDDSDELLRSTMSGKAGGLPPCGKVYEPMIVQSPFSNCNHQPTLSASPDDDEEHDDDEDEEALSLERPMATEDIFASYHRLRCLMAVFAESIDSVSCCWLIRSCPLVVCMLLLAYCSV
jgi:hypothetical protein